MLDIVIPAYNPGRYLEGCLKSCFAQNYEGAYRVILVDDGSTEGIAQVVAPYLDRIQLIRLEENSGPAAARNAGIAASSGEWILFQDADDYMSENRLTLTAKAIQENPELVMVCGNFRWQIDGKITALCFTTPPEIYFATLLVHFPINTSTVALKRSVLEKTGLFDTRYPVAEDYDLWMRVTKRYPEQIGYIADELSLYNWCSTESSLTKKYRHTPAYQQVLAELSRKYGAL